MLPRPPQVGQVTGRSGRALRYWNVPFELLVAWVWGLLSPQLFCPCKQTSYQGFIKRPMFATKNSHALLKIAAPSRAC